MVDPRCADAELIPCRLLLDIHDKVTTILKTLCELQAEVVAQRTEANWTSEETALGKEI